MQLWNAPDSPGQTDAIMAGKDKKNKERGKNVFHHVLIPITDTKVVIATKGK